MQHAQLYQMNKNASIESILAVKGDVILQLRLELAKMSSYLAQLA